MAWRWVAVIALIGCGRIGFDANSDGVASDSGGGGDVTALTCTRYDFELGLPTGFGAWSDAAGFAAQFLAGELVIQQPASSNGYAGVNTDNAIDMRGVRISVEVPVVAAPMNCDAYVTAFVDVPNQYLIFYELDGLWFRRALAGDATQQGTGYNASEQRFWRIEHHTSSNEVAFSTSRDAVTWLEHYRVPATLQLDSLKLELGGGCYSGGTPSPMSPRFDNLEVCVR